MQVDIRFVSKAEARTIASKTRECASIAEALRWAATVLEKSTPEDQLRVNGVRIREVVPVAPSLVPA